VFFPKRLRRRVGRRTRHDGGGGGNVLLRPTRWHVGFTAIYITHKKKTNKQAPHKKGRRKNSAKEKREEKKKV
jgi:hypothetical protein